MAQPRLNLSKISVLLADRNLYTRTLISQSLRAFSVKYIYSCDTGAAALEYLGQAGADLALIEADLPDMSGADLIRTIRANPKEPLRFVPIIVLSGYTQMRMLGDTRDAGANLVVKKPVSPQSLFDRISWLGRTKRAYIEAPNYIGPDRRFHDIDPPDGAFKRSTDKSQDVSPQKQVALSQETTS